MMTKTAIFPCLLIISIFACTTKKSESTTAIGFTPYVEICDSSANQLFEVDAKVEILAEGFEWTEGPLWVDGLGLLFSDIPPNKVYKWTEAKGVELYLTPSGYTGVAERGGEPGANGLAQDKQGNLILCQHGDRRMARMARPLTDPAAEFVTIVDNYNGKRFNSPNDACFDSRGNLYFTDPPYGLEKLMDDPLKELGFQGVYRYGSDGLLTLLDSTLSRPNGIAFSTDFQRLFVANSDPQLAIWMVYDVDEQGLLQNGRVFHDATKMAETETGLPDGMKVDSKGNVFATGPGGVWVFNDSGMVLAKIRTGQATSNCAFGPGQRELFITADMYLMRVRLKG
ncbi:MAG: SMP-30/gluconolactonase/LRE family protein [Cyclobacteriaceae bacterium]|nr:SMP-30/gluconolactonase/LRE family protein [Cyclobacteriaceae bacterium]